MKNIFIYIYRHIHWIHIQFIRSKMATGSTSNTLPRLFAGTHLRSKQRRPPQLEKKRLRQKRVSFSWTMQPRKPVVENLTTSLLQNTKSTYSENNVPSTWNRFLTYTCLFEGYRDGNECWICKSMSMKPKQEGNNTHPCPATHKNSVVTHWISQSLYDSDFMSQTVLE